MIKTELSLQTLINLKPTIEQLIESSFKKIVSNNAVIKKQKGTKVDTEAEYDKYKKLQTQLQVVKNAIFKTNKSKNSLGVPNQQTIFEKSDLERELNMLNTLFDQKNHAQDKKTGDDLYEFTIPKKDIQDRIKEIETRITELKKALTEFNQSTTTKIELDKELELL